MTHTNAIEYRDALVSAIEARAAYELDKSSENDSMQATLTDIRKSVEHVSVASVMFIANVDSNLINKSERVNARFNVYAYEKVANISRSAAKACALNHYSLAILKVAKLFAENDMTMTHDDAQSACSLSVKSSDAKREKLIATCKYQKHVSAKTASTQSSSSINALQAFDVLRESRDAANRVVYTINPDAETTKLLLARID